jgi:hypothetical protein
MTEYAAALQEWLAGSDASGERAALPRPAPAGFRKKSTAHADDLARVRALVRQRFALADDVTVVVTELACAVPGCPPVETVVAFWTAPERRHHFKVFKPVADVTLDDLPLAWLKDALVVADGDCDCC